MNIGQDSVVHIHYTLRDDKGEVLDTSEGSDPLAYLHGQGGIVPGLEAALEGKAVGDRIDVTLQPEDGYGPRDERLVQLVPRARFGDATELEPGMRFQAQGPQGARMVTITRVDKDFVTVDGNHPLAGRVLNFAVEVTGVRKATRQELDHGHVHGPGGHHH